MTDPPPQDPSTTPDPRPGQLGGIPARMLHGICWIWSVGSRKMKSLYLWVLHWAETPYGTPALFVLSFAEASFFPIPPDPLQIALSVSKPKRSFYYALVNGLGSVAGAMLGWAIGYFLWESSGDLIIRCIPGLTQDRYEVAAGYFEQWGFLAILIAAFTPIPFKVFTIAAGGFHVPFIPFVLVTAVSRGMRFFLVAGLIRAFGDPIREFIDRYLNLLTIVFAALLIGGFLALGVFSAR